MRTPWRHLAKRSLIFLIHLYRNTLSHSMLHSCRFFPTCSEFAIEAIERHGTVRGSWLTIHRLGRCQPFGRYGIDPVK